MGLEVFGPGDLYTHARGPNRVILNGASDNPGAPAMAEAVFGPGDLYTHARGPNRVILNGASDNPGAPAMAEAPDQFSRGGPFFPKKSVRPDQFSTENFVPPDQNFPDQNSDDTHLVDRIASAGCFVSQLVLLTHQHFGGVATEQR